MPPVITVVIPTRGRSDILKRCLDSLSAQTLPAENFEVVVVVDDENDPTYQWLNTYSPPYAFHHYTQRHLGLSAARNLGNAHAKSDIILSLDDDMIASPRLLAEHVNAQNHLNGGWVQGALDIHESVERTPFIRFEEQRRKRFHQSRVNERNSLDAQDVSGGNFSIPKQLLEQAGGFNPHPLISADTDGELAWKLERLGVRFHYASDALAHMLDVKDFEDNFKRSFQCGKSYVHQSEKEPELKWRHSPLINDRRSPVRNICRRIFFSRSGKPWFPKRLKAILFFLGKVIEVLPSTRLRACYYRSMLDYAFWHGVHEQNHGDLSAFAPIATPVLAYHNVSDKVYPDFTQYVLPIKKFQRQICWLKRKGYSAVKLDDLSHYLIGNHPLPPKPVVITFDDGYEELARNATPFLSEHKIPHTYFVTTGKLDGTTDWIERCPDIPLLRRRTIERLLQEHGEFADFQAHGKDHLSFATLDETEITREVTHSIETLQALTGREVRYFAYPFGEYNSQTPVTMSHLPIRCSFTVDKGLCRPGLPAHLLPRVEIFTDDTILDFALKIRFGFSPIATIRRKLKGTLAKLTKKDTNARYVSEFYANGEPLRQTVLALLPCDKANTLDLGCKTGDVTREIAKKRKNLTAMDWKWSDEWKASDIRFLQGDARYLPFKENSFDLVVSMEMLQYIEDWRGVIQEARRILAPQGQFVITFPEGGFCSIHLDPFRLCSKLTRFFNKRKKEEAFPRRLNLREVLSYCEEKWHVDHVQRQGSLAYIYLACLIDYSHTLEKTFARSSILGSTICAKSLKLLNLFCMKLMRIDFSFSWGSWSYNNIVVLRIKFHIRQP